MKQRGMKLLIRFFFVYTTVEHMAWMENYILYKNVDIMTYPYPHTLILVKPY